MKKRIATTIIIIGALLAGVAFFKLKKPGKIKEFDSAVTTVDNIQIPEGTRIVALGEATHGNKEFQELKLEVFQTLVENSDVRALILEGDFGGCAIANEYIQGGEGSAEEVTKMLGYRIYRTDEMCELVQWMHDYNMTAAEDDKVRLYGMDIQRGAFSAEVIEDFYAEVDEDKYNDYSSRIDAVIDKEEDTYDPADYDNIISLMDEIAADIETNRDAYIESTSLAEVETCEQATVAIKCYLDLNEKENYSNKYRDSKMKEFVDWTLEIEEREHEGELMMACHNGHMTQATSSVATYLGVFLNEEYGDAYFAIGTDYYITNDNMPSADGRVVKEFSSGDKLAYQVKKMDEDKVYLDFSTVDSNSKLGNVINNPMRMGSIGEQQYNIITSLLSSATSIKKTPSDLYDAMILYYEVTPTETWEN